MVLTFVLLCAGSGGCLVGLVLEFAEETHVVDDVGGVVWIWLQGL